MKRIQKGAIIKTIAIIISIVVFPFWSVNLIVFSNYESNINSIDNKPKTALVLGAGVRGDLPGKVLQLRLDKSADMFLKGWIKNILVSGANPDIFYNEPQIMRNYLVNSWKIPANRIFTDYGGRRTIDSCWRAKNVFRLDSVFVITQSFHLARSTFLCRHVGLNTVPVIAEDSNILVTRDGLIREFGANWELLFNILTSYKPPIQGTGDEVLPK